MSAKKNLTVRLDTELRDKLEFIAEREYRTLANQITVFLINGVNSYFNNDGVKEAYQNHLKSDTGLPF